MSDTERTPMPAPDPAEPFPEPPWLSHAWWLALIRVPQDPEPRARPEPPR